MSDWQTLKLRIADEMVRGELTRCATAVQRAALTAIDYFSRRRFWFNEFIDNSHSTTSTTAVMTLTATLRVLKLDSVKVTIGTRDYPLYPISYNLIDSIDEGTWEGYPENYAWYANVLRFYPRPNSSYLVKLSGLRKLAEPSATSLATFENEWTNDCEELVRLRAKGILFRDVLREHQQAEAMFVNSERRYKELTRETADKVGTGRIRGSVW